MGWDGSACPDSYITDGTFAELLARRRTREENKIWQTLIRAGDVGNGLAQLFRETGAIAPNKLEQRTISRFLTENTALNFLSIVCPDYATRKDGDTVRYTFDSLGNGVGVVASRAFDVFTRLSRFFAGKDPNRNASFILAIADQEANEENCKRVGVGREEFLARLRNSQRALADQATAAGIQIATPLLTEIDPIRWKSSQERTEGLIGTLPKNLLLAARRERYSFYERWAGRCLRSEEAEAMFMAQIKDYVAVGDYVASDNRVIIGLDAPVMAPFVRHGAAATPVIYFKRPDY